MSSIDSGVAPPREKETKPNTGVNRLSAKLYGDLQQRIKHLELSYMRQDHVPIRMYAAFQIVRKSCEFETNYRTPVMYFDFSMSQTINMNTMSTY